MQKKWFTAMLAAACLAGTLGLTACVGNPTGESSAHTHSWSGWTVENGNEPTATEVGKATRTCSGGDDCDGTAADKEYSLPCLTDWNYIISDNTATIDAAGTQVYTYVQGEVKISFTLPSPVLESLIYTVTVNGAPAGVKVKLGKYSGETDADGVAKVKAEKKNYDVVIENDGYSYVAGKVTCDEPETAVAGLPVSNIAGATNTSRFDKRSILYGAGVYTTYIFSKQDAERTDKYTTVDRYFRLDCKSGAKKYTVRILSDNTTVMPEEAGYDMISGVGGSYSIVLEAGENTVFSIVSNDDNVDKDYRFDVVFEIVEDEAPEKGDYMRPVRLENATESVISVEAATQKVYYKLNYATFGRYAEITFGEGVSVYSLGYNKGNAGTAIQSGDVVNVSYYGAYLYAVSSGSDCAVTAEIHYVEGMKENPSEATVTGDNAVNLDMANSVYEQWFRLQTAAGMYTVTPDANHAKLTIYADVNGSPISTASSGGAVIVSVADGACVYIKAASSLNAPFKFTVTEFGDGDKGLSASAPLELTASGEYNFYFNRYYTYTAEKDVVVKFSSKGVSGYSYFWYSKEGFTNQKNSTKTLLLTLNAGETCYIRMTNSNEKDGGTFVFGIIDIEHNLNITVTDGTDVYDGVTVKILKSGEVAASGVSANGGKVSFVLEPYSYTLVLENLPEGFGHYTVNTVIEPDAQKDIETTAMLTALEDYSVTVKLPDGSSAEGVTVKFVNKYVGTFTAVTGADGVAKITQLPPAKYANNTGVTADAYTVEVILPDSMKGVYSFVGKLSLTAAEPSKEALLSDYIEPDGTLENPYLPTENGTYSGTATESDMDDGEEYVKCYIYTAPENGTIVFTVEDENTVICAVTEGFEEATYFPAGKYIFMLDPDSVELSVEKGMAVYIIAGNIDGTGDYSFNLEFIAD